MHVVTGRNNQKLFSNNTSFYWVTRGFNWTWRAFPSTINKQHWTIQNLYIISNEASLSDAFTNVEPHQDLCGHQPIPHCILSKSKYKCIRLLPKGGGKKNPQNETTDWKLGPMVPKPHCGRLPSKTVRCKCKMIKIWFRCDSRFVKFIASERTHHIQ